MPNVLETDFIVVGSGSAGSVVAARLGVAARVTLLEAGPEDGALSIRMPAAVSINIKGKRYNWKYLSEPQDALAGRRLAHPRGRVLGGSSSINGMIFIRGHGFDYDRWVTEGATGWSYADVLPYFKRLETFRGNPSTYRGTAGPVPVTVGIASNPLHAAFLEAGQQAGHPFTKDVNGYQQFGVSYFDKNILGGERWSASRAYLRSTPPPPNLSVITNALATRIVLEKGRATGVEYFRDGRTHQIRCLREVIVCAGAFESPKLLMLSGIGSAEQLRRLKIPVEVDLPHVGRNLQDHAEVHVQYRCRKPITLFGDLSFRRRLLIGARWLISRSGKGATNHYDTGAFLHTDTGETHPDVQLHFVPIVYNNTVERRTDCHGFRLHAGPVRSRSRGWLELKSSNPLDQPLINPQYFSEPSDWIEMRKTIALSREIAAQRAFDDFRGTEMSPGEDLQSQADLDRFIRETGDTGYHPAGTCRMGPPDAGVVNPDCQVYGTECLRVVDASTMPSIVSGNLNAPVMMMAEKVSDAVLGIPRLAPEAVPIYEAEQHRR